MTEQRQWTWEPVNSVPYPATGEDGIQMISCEWQESPFTHETEQVFATHPVWGEGQTVILPPGYALCRRVPAQGAGVPVEVREAMQLCAATVKLIYHRGDIGYADSDSVIAAERIERWLDAQPGQE